MAAPTPTTEPICLIAGDTAKWLKSLADYPASEGWALSYTFINAATKITINAAASGNDYLVTASASTTSNWSAGSYAWRASVSKSGEVYTVATGTIDVKAAFSGATLDNRTHARKALDNIEAYLVDPANLAAQSYEIAGRKLSRIPRGELLKERDRLRADVAREDAASRSARGLPDGRRAYVRFGP